MSEIAEIRKLFQDLIAPDLKSVATEMAALKTSVEHQFKAQRELIDLQIKNLTEKMEARFGSMELRFDSADALEQARFAAVIGKIEAIKGDFAAMEAAQSKRHEDILKALDIDRRLERVEASQSAASQVA